MPAKKTSNTGHRLTTKQKNAIAKAGPATTNTELAEKFETSMQTIARYRTTTPTRGRKAATTASDIGSTVTKAPSKAKGGINMDTDGEFIVLRIHKSRKNVVQGLVDQLLS